MELPEVASELRAFTKKSFDINDDDADFDDVHLFDYGYVDSFGALSVVSFLEARFGVTVTDEDLVNDPPNTIREFVKLVQKRLEETK